MSFLTPRFLTPLYLPQLATAKKRAKKLVELEKCEKKLDRLIHEGKGDSASAKELKKEVRDLKNSFDCVQFFF